MRTAAWVSAKLMKASAICMLLLCACAVNVHKVQVDTARLETGKPIGTLHCAYSLTGVLDARPVGDRAGGLGEHMLLLENPSALIAESLRKAGLAVSSLPDSIDVHIAIKRFYLSQNLVTKVPVVVLQARIDQQEPFLVRAQPVTANWNGTENEAYSALANALQGAVTQLVSDLNGRCSAKQSTPP